MQKFTFNKHEDLLIPSTSFFKPIKDSKGNILGGDDLMKIMENVADAYEKNEERPVPVPDQKFISWVRQYNKMRSEGNSSEKIFQRTLSKI